MKEAMMKGLSFHVDKGEFVSLIGASGCGKSTIFRLINRLLEPDQGEIYVDGKEIHGIKSYAGYMPQKDLLFPWRTIEKNLCLPMEIQKKSKAEQEKRVTEVLREVGLEDYRNKYPKDLSGGMRQRISFARTLLTDAELMLLDEPFSALDALTRMDMQEWLLRQWEHFHKTILFITHDVEEAVFLSKKIYIITETPITQIEIAEVPEGYPRNREFLRRPEIEALKSRLTMQLRKQVM
ncbi:MAG: ABC transporter ATP-binding protein [Frisingicoccus sp.]